MLKIIHYIYRYQAVESMRNGMDPSAAAQDAIERIVRKAPNFTGAVIAANKAGYFGTSKLQYFNVI